MEPYLSLEWKLHVLTCIEGSLIGAGSGNIARRRCGRTCTGRFCTQTSPSRKEKDIQDQIKWEKGEHLKADWTFKNCADSFAASELLLQTLAVRTLMASFVFISFILLRPFFSFYHNLTLKWVGLTLESVAALAKSTFSLTWTFLLCSARVYNTLKIAFPRLEIGRVVDLFHLIKDHFIWIYQR